MGTERRNGEHHPHDGRAVTGMRALGPTGDPLDVAALAAAYAYPADPPRGRWLRANMVGTADGAAMATSGVTRDISNDVDRELLALLRALCDVVLVGPGTVRAERYGPAKVRPAHAALRDGRPPPPIAVISAGLDLDFDWPLFTEPAVPTIVLTTSAADPDRLAAARKVADVEVLSDPAPEGSGGFGVDLSAAVAALAARGHSRLLCEGGPGLLASLCAEGLVDEICLALSPMLSGGRAGRILRGVELDGGLPLRLGHALIDDEDFLFLRYTVTQ